jgi:hypothetical protein
LIAVSLTENQVRGDDADAAVGAVRVTKDPARSASIHIERIAQLAKIKLAANEIVR